MLRIRHRDSDTPFEFRRISRKEVRQVIKGFLQQWGRRLTNPVVQMSVGKVLTPGPEEVLLISPTEFIAEWQDGDGDWDFRRPTEPVPMI